MLQISVMAAPGLDRVLVIHSAPYMQVLGTAPNREWVLEYRDMTFSPCPEQQNLKAQLIFFENSSDIQFNLAEYAPICGDGSKWPVIGIQYNELSFTRFDGPLHDEMSLRFSASGVGGNNAPVVTADTIAHQVTHGEPFSLDLSPYFSDSDGDSLSYYVVDIPDGVQVVGSQLTGSLDYGETDLGFIERYVYASDGVSAAKANVRLIFDGSRNFPPRPIAPLPEPVFYFGEGAHFPMRDLFFDPEGDEFTFDSQSVSPGFALWENGVLRGAFSSFEGPLGESEISFKVTDGHTVNTVTMTVHVQEDRGNLPPEVITPIGNIQVEVGKMFRIALNDHFADPNGDSIVHSYNSPPPVQLIYGISPEPILGGVPDASWLAGSPHTFSWLARDSNGGNTVHDFQITVSDPNAPASAAPSDAEVAGSSAMDEVTVVGKKKETSGAGALSPMLLIFFALSPFLTRASLSVI